MKHESCTYSNTISSRSRTMCYSTEGSADIDEYCTKLHAHNKESSSHYMETLKYYDTLIHSDIVRNQYMTLPYPAVSPEELIIEKTHYERIYKTGMRKVPYNLIPGVSLEALNHYLYKGRNTFRLAYTSKYDKP